MITKNSVTTTTPNTLVLGIASNGRRAAITGAMVLLNGDTEPDVIQTTGSDLWQTVTDALDDLRIVKAKHLLLLTTAGEYHQFLQPPIFIEQPTVTKVRVGRDVFTARTGGNKYQWKLLRQLFCYVWRCEAVERLGNAERLLNE